MESFSYDNDPFVKNLIDIDKKSSMTSKSLRLNANVLLRRESHSKTVLRAVLTDYSKSIAYAIPGSEELVLGYNNRSILMHHLKKYDLALVDIEEALSITTSVPLKSKLLIRKISCLKATGRKIEPSIIRTVTHLIGEVVTNEIKEQLQNILEKALKVQIDAHFSVFVPRSIPEMTRSREIPCASNAVAVNYDKTFGRHLKVNRFIPPGEILIIEDAYVNFPSSEDRYLICSNCLDNTFTAIPCDSCPCVVYCSKFCKNDAWTRYHKIECSILQLISKKCSDILLCRCLRIVIVALNERNFELDMDFVIDENRHVETDNSDKRTKGFFEGQFLSNKVRCFLSLEDHKENIESHGSLGNQRDSDVIEECALYILHLLQPALLAKLSESDKKVFYQSRKWYALKELIEKILRITRINSLQNQQIREFSEEPNKNNIFDNVSGDLGTNITIGCSLINHSCSPNAGRFFKNGKCIVFSLRPITSGEQIFITYRYDVDEKKVKRQQHLRDSYYFDCNCLACKLNIFVDGEAIVDKRKQLFETLPNDFRNFFEAMGPQKLPLLFDGGSFNLSTISDKNIWSEYIKWKISKIFRKKRLVDALVETSMYESILSSFYHEIYSSSKLLIERCC